MFQHVPFSTAVRQKFTEAYLKHNEPSRSLDPVTALSLLTRWSSAAHAPEPRRAAEPTAPGPGQVPDVPDLLQGPPAGRCFPRCLLWSKGGFYTVRISCPKGLRHYGRAHPLHREIRGVRSNLRPCRQRIRPLYLRSQEIHIKTIVKNLPDRMIIELLGHACPMP